METSGREKSVGSILKESMAEIPAPASPAELVRFIRKRYPHLHESTIRTQITVCCVNMPSRLNYEENQKPRVATDPHLDVLYRVDFGQYLPYDPNLHGTWEIAEEGGELVVRMALSSSPPEKEAEAATELPPEQEFAPVVEGTEEGEVVMDTKSARTESEAHLWEVLKKDLTALEPGLVLFVSAEGGSGLNYSTPVGSIDFLAKDANENLAVILIRGSEEKSSQAVADYCLRAGWVKDHLAGNRAVRGFLLLPQIAPELRYAAKAIPNLKLYEYEFKFEIREAK